MRTATVIIQDQGPEAGAQLGDKNTRYRSPQTLGGGQGYRDFLSWEDILMWLEATKYFYRLSNTVADSEHKSLCVYDGDVQVTRLLKAVFQYWKAVWECPHKF